MHPIVVITKKIDDIELYFEIYAGGVLAERFKNDFIDGKFVANRDEIMVFLHGNGEDSSIFKNLIDVFCTKYYCIAVDSRGHGKTTIGNSEFSIDLMAEDIAALCDSIGIGKFRLLGFSDGGNIALTYAVRHPERISAIITIGANINPEGLRVSFKIPTYIKYFFAKLNKNKSREANLRYQLLSIMINYPHISPRLLGNISCPSLVMDGAHDVIKKSHSDLISASIPGSVRITVPNSTHNVLCDNPQFVAENILRWFNNL